MQTVPNDGSVSGDPCHNCDGQLILRTVPGGGYFLGCTAYHKGCTFKMGPNSDEMGKLAEERSQRHKERLLRRQAREEAEERKRVEAEKRQVKPRFCENCGCRFSNIEALSGQVAHAVC